MGDQLQINQSGNGGSGRGFQSIIFACYEEDIRPAVLRESPEVLAASGDVSHEPEMFRMLERLCERDADPSLTNDGEGLRLRCWCHDPNFRSHKVEGATGW